MKGDKFDFHIHSNFSSDGTISPKEIYDEAVSCGLSYFSITDHNTVAGNLDMLSYKNKLNGKVKFITGIELSAYVGELEIHLLSYGYDPESLEMNELILEYRKNRVKQAEARTDKLISMGYKLDFEELMKEADGKTPSGVTFLTVLKRYEENNKFIEEYVTGAKSDSPYTNFYFDYFYRGGKAYVSVPLLDYMKTVEMLKDQSFLVIAHPALYPKNILNDLVVDGVRGVEVFCSYHDDEKRKFFSDFAEGNKLTKTAGSDFHGERIKPGIVIGGHGCTDESVIDDFLDEIGRTPFSPVAL